MVVSGSFSPMTGNRHRLHRKTLESVQCKFLLEMLNTMDNEEVHGSCHAPNRAQLLIPTERRQNRKVVDAHTGDDECDFVS